MTRVTPRHPVVLRSELLRAGHTPDEVQRRRRRGELAVVRRGAYTDGDEARAADAVAAHRMRVEAAARQLARGSVISHESAAVLFGLPCWGMSLRRVHATRNRSSGGRVTRDLHLHGAALEDDEITEVGGLLVTTPARTVADIARRAGFEPAVALADAALARPDRRRPPLTTPAELVEALDRGARRPGTPAARRAITFADGRSESVGESRSRVAIMLADLPAPVLQWEVMIPSGPARTDFAWPQLRVVGEFDGKVKYGRLLEPGQDPGEVVYAEKLREDALRAQGLTVIRWTWQELSTFAATSARLDAALRRS